MTTDPFTTADDRWDESPHHLADHCEHAGVGKACRRCRRKFDAASQWARDYLAAQEPTDAEVLAALNAQGVVVSPKMRPAPSLDYWGDKPAEAMRAALTAARRDEEK